MFNEVVGQPKKCAMEEEKLEEMDWEARSLFLANKNFHLMEDLKDERARAANAEDLLQHKKELSESIQEDMTGSYKRLEEMLDRQREEASRMRDIASSTELKLIQSEKEIEKLVEENKLLKREMEKLKKSSSIENEGLGSASKLEETIEKEKHISFEEIYNLRSRGNVTIISSGARFPIHELVLTYHSAWFVNNIKEKIRKGEKLEFEIDNCTTEAIQELIKFLYVKKLDNAKSHLSFLWKLAIDYEIAELKEQLEKAWEPLTFSNVGKEYDFAVQHGLTNRTESIHNFIVCNPGYFESSEFKMMRNEQKSVQNAVNMLVAAQKHFSFSY